jgi:hypothetical protein
LHRFVLHVTTVVRSHRAGWCSSNALQLCPGCNRLKSRSGHRLSWLKRIVIFLSLSKLIPGLYSHLETCYNRFLQRRSTSPLLSFDPTQLIYRMSRPIE